MTKIQADRRPASYGKKTRLKRALAWWRRKIPAWCVTAAVAGAILWLTLARTPLPETDLPSIPGVDKVVHAIMFGTLTLVMCWDWYVSSRRPLQMWQTALCATVAIAAGGAIELIQGAMGCGRSADIMDFVADTVGAVAVMCVIMGRTRRYIKRAPRQDR